MAKPDGGVATVSALVLNIVRSVDGAVCNATSNILWHAFWAKKVLFVKVWVVYYAFCAIPTPNKIGLLAIVTLLVR